MNEEVQVLVLAEFLNNEGRPTAKKLKKLLAQVPDDAEPTVSLYPQNGASPAHWDLRCSWNRGLKEVQGVTR